MSVKKFIKMDPNKLTDEVAEMCNRLGISGSIGGVYDLYEAVLREQEQAKERLKKQKEIMKQALKATS